MNKSARVEYCTDLDTRFRETIRQREKQINDKYNALSYARKQGMKAGEEKGRAEEKAAIIAKLEAYGMTQEQIKEALSDNE